MAAQGVQQVVGEIDALASLDDWARLDALIERYFALPDAASHLDVWFRLWERFPIDNGDDNKRFWTIMHVLEAQPSFERLVIASIRRKPADFPLLMVNRMLNAGDNAVAGADLLALLRSVAEDEKNPSEARETARGFLEWQEQRRAGGT